MSVRGRRGWTIIELLMVMLILGILVNIAVPGLRLIRRRAEAAHIIGDMRVIHVAALAAHADRGVYPPTDDWGSVPPPFVPALPEGFEFRYGEAMYRWHRYAAPDGSPMDPSQTELLAVEVRVDDPGMASTIRALYKGRLTFGSSTNVFFILE